MNDLKITWDIKLKSDFGDVYYDLYEPSFLDSNTESKPLNIIQISHGMLEHKGRYENLAKQLAAANFIVAVSDHRGHGNSINAEHKITLGEMGEDGLHKATYDLYKLNRTLFDKYKTTNTPKIILLGHSMGSIIARRYIMLYADSIDCLILSGSPSLDSRAKSGILMAKIFRLLGLNNIGSKIMHKKILGEFNKPFKNDKNGGNWMSSNKEVVEAFKNDPKCQAIFSINSIISLLNGLLEVYDDYPKVKNANLPILFVSGYDDPCGQNGDGVKFARDHLIKQGYLNVDLLLYENTRHEVFNEKIAPNAIKDILLWLRNNGITNE